MQEVFKATLNCNRAGRISSGGPIFGYGRVFIYIISFLLLIQFLVALFCSALGCTVGSIKQLFALKQIVILLAFVFGCLAILRYRRITSIDFWAILFGIYIFVTPLIHFTDQQAVIYGMKLYLNPILLYFIGRKIKFNFIKKDLNFIVILFSITIIIFVIIFNILNEKILFDLNIGRLYMARGDVIHSDNELLPTCYFLTKNGTYIRRAFGPFLDPLTLAFFLVPLIFWFRYKKKKQIEYILYILLLFVLLITITRAIIGALIIVYFFTGVKNGRYFARTKLIFTLMVVAFITISIFIKYLLNIADPSTWGHLSAYNTFLSTSIQNPMGIGYFRSALEKPDLGFHSTESLYLAMTLENGIPFLVLFIIIIIKLHRILIQNQFGPIQYMVHSSLLAYIIASFTTEHWFAVSSSSLFWIFAGIAVTDIEDRKRMKVFQDTPKLS